MAAPYVVFTNSLNVPVYEYLIKAYLKEPSKLTEITSVCSFLQCPTALLLKND